MFQRITWAFVAVLLSATVASAQYQSAQDQKERVNPPKPIDPHAIEQQLKAFETLNLSDEQREQLSQIIREHDNRMAKVWQNFHALHMRAVRLEAMMLAALEDELTESQRERFREMRQQQRQPHEGQGVAEGERTGQRREALRPTFPEQQPQPNQSPPNQQPEEQQPDQKQVLIFELHVRTPADMIRELGLSGQQKEECDALCSAYQRTITSTWQRIHATHLQLVSLEAEKLQKIEGVLTEEQLKTLHELRRTPNINPNTSIHESLSGKVKEAEQQQERPQEK